MSSTSPAGPEGTRQYGAAAAMAFVVGTMVGTGIYLKPAQVSRLAPESWQNLALWAAGGLFALCGALVYARLAEVWPESGGAYVYLRNCYGDWVGSLLMAADVLLGRPAAVGALATGLGLIWSLPPEQTLMVAVATLVCLAAGQALGRKAIGGMQVVLTLLKLMPFALIAGAGMTLPAAAPTPTGEPVFWAGGFLAVLWAYDGWYNIAILGGEVSRPERNLRRSLVGGVLLVTVFYLAMNALVLAKISRAEMLAKDAPLPFVLLLNGWAWGPGLGLAVQVGLTISVLATLNGTLACGPSMLAAGGLSDLRSVRRGTLLFTGWCLGMLLLFAGLPSQFALFDQLSEYTAVVVAGLSGLTVTCLFRLPRFGQRVDPVSGLAALLFLTVDLALVVMLLVERPGLAVAGALSVLAAGSALHALRRRPS